MANVRYTSGGSSATLGTKTIDENGIYNASSDNLDGYSTVTVDVPQPSGTISLEYTTNGERTVDVADYENANINVSVPAPVQPTQEKTVNAQINQVVVTPDNGYLLRRVTVDPQRNFDTYTPQPNEQYNDMGVVNRYRYVDTRGMITPSGTKEVTYNNNGTHTEDVTDYTDISVEVDVPVSGDLGTKTITVNGTYTALDDGLDGYSEVDVNVPQNATLGIKSITANGNYYAVTDGYDGYSRVDVDVPGAALQSSKTVTATTSQQTVTPDSGYDGLEQVIVDPQVHTQTYTPAADTAANDMGAQNNYRYVDTSGMVVPTLQSKSVTATTSAQTVTADGGYTGLSSVTVNPQVHTQTYTPAANTAANDMGAQNNYRYVNTSGMIVPSGNKSLSYDTNGTYSNIDVSGNATASVTVNVPTPTLSGNATAADVKSGKTFYNNSYTKYTGTYTPGFTSSILWTNPNINNNFAAQTVNLLDSVQNYDYIRINYIWAPGSSYDAHSVLFSKEDFTYYNDRPVGVIGFRSTTSGNSRVRALYPPTNTSVQFGASYQNTSSSQTASAAYIIPTTIHGLKFK